MTKQTPIHIRAGDLKPALVGLGKVVPPRSSNELLRCVRIDPVDSKSIRLGASDGDVYLDLVVPAQVGEKFAPFLVPLPVLRDHTKGYKAGETLTMPSSSKAPDPGKFPEPTAFRASPIPLPDRISRSLVKAFDCASHDETRYILRGAHLDVSGKGKQPHRIVATDGRQLFSSNSMQFPNLKKSVILPDHKLWRWKPMAESKDWTLRIGPEKDGGQPFRIEGPFWKLSGTCLDGNYPNYRQVIPDPAAFKTRVRMSEDVAEAIVGLIPKLPGKKSDNRPLGIHVEKGLVSLLAREDGKEPWLLHPIGKADIEGPDQIVFANRDYVGRALRFGLRELSLVDESSPMRFSYGGDLMIVMPVRAGDADKVKRPRKIKPLVDGKAKPAPAKKAAPKKRAAVSNPRTKRPAKPDPITEVETRIAEANDALASAGQQLASATGSLKTVRSRRRDDQEELKGFRSLFFSIKKMATGSN